MKVKTIVYLWILSLVCAVLPLNAWAAPPDGVPSALEAPLIQKVELMHYDDGVPYFRAQVKIPQSILAIIDEKPAGGSVFWDWAVKIDNGSWTEFGGGGYLDTIVESEEAKVPGVNDTYYISFDPEDEGAVGEIDIKSHKYSYKIIFYYDYYEGWPDITPIYSPASNVISIGVEDFYSNASEWAINELNQASELDIIPDILKDTDLTKPINREEFAELAVRLYEMTTQSTAEPASPNPFTDTKNPQILKAYALGITKGTTDTTFAPKELITREQCATMLFRTIKMIAPDGDYNISGIKDFSDQKHISAYAVEATKYMYSIGIIKGDTAGNFMPKATTSAQQAAGYGMATREAAILMTVKTYKTFIE